MRANAASVVETQLLCGYGALGIGLINYYVADILGCCCAVAMAINHHGQVLLC